VSGYFFSPFDLQLIDQVDALAEAGVSALKIEGRMKSAEYVSAAVSAYRLVLDALDEDEATKTAALEKAHRILAGDFARKKTIYRMEEPFPSPATYLDAAQSGGTGVSLGTIKKTRGTDGARFALLETTATIDAGDSIRLHRADDSERVTHKAVTVEKAREGVWVSIPDGFSEGDTVYLIQHRGGGKRYPHVIPPELNRYKRQPGFEKAPETVIFDAPLPSTFRRSLPEGLYCQFSRMADLYIAQSIRPDAVIIEYNADTRAALLSTKEMTPFPRKNLLVSFPPFFPRLAEERLESELPTLLERGITRFIVNNLGQLALLKKASAKTPSSSLTLIAGPYLYAFNRRSAAFLAAEKFTLLCGPLENNRQNLEKTFLERERRRVWVPVFAWPALFRFRGDLAKHYRFGAFTDDRDEAFKLLGNGESSLVVPMLPFSIVDKTPFLEQAGFRRFLADFSGPRLTKQDYRTVVQAIRAEKPLMGVSRFNWKDGFFVKATR
jgi:putative protease